MYYMTYTYYITNVQHQHCYLYTVLYRVCCVAGVIMPSSSYDELNTLISDYVHCSSEESTCRLKERLHSLQPECSEEVFQLLTTVKDDHHECTAIHKTMVRNHPEMLTCFFNKLTSEQRFKLLEMGNVNKWTALHAAALTGAINPFKCIRNSVTAEQIYKLLTMKDKNGCTALHLAASKGCTELVEAMLDSVKRDQQIQLLDITNNDNRTTLDIALQFNKQSTADLIKQYRLQFNHQGETTPVNGKN